MRIFRNVMRVISLTLLLSTAICGLYVHANKTKLEDYDSSIQFHVSIGIAAIVFTAVTMFLQVKPEKRK
jgi:putative exporter of polyketide antibiotics